MDFQTVIYEKKDHIATIVMNRPERLNALNEKMHHELHWIWQDIEDDPEVWCAILTGNGRAFCVGADVKEAADTYDEGDMLNRWGAMGDFVGKAFGLDPMYGTHMFGFPGKPLIAAVNGLCVGGGLALAARSDMIICDESAQFFDTHVNVGIAPVHETIDMARLIGRTNAFRIAFLGNRDRMSAERAFQLGLVSEIVPDDKLRARAQEIAETIVTWSSPDAVRALKAAVYATDNLPHKLQHEMAHVYLHQVRVSSPDAQEGPRAFREKRTPNWRAR